MVSDIHAAVYRLYNEFKQLSDIEEWNKNEEL
jgi:hypothetical protein